MNFNILTLFPDFFQSPSINGVLEKAIQKNIIQKNIVCIRDFSDNSYQSVDDRPFGGGDGMVLSYLPLENALKSITNKGLVVYLSPQGQQWNHQLAKQFSKQYSSITLVCGRYSGIDARWLHRYVNKEISIGDYVLSGAEVAALVVMDSVARFVPGVLGHTDSATTDTFENDGLLQYPKWTRPRNIHGYQIPEVFFSGHHKELTKAKYYLSLLQTAYKRPDLLDQKKYNSEIQEAKKWFFQLSKEEQKATGITLLDQ